MKLATTRERSWITLAVGESQIRFSLRDPHSRQWFAGNCGGGQVHEAEVTRFLVSHLKPEVHVADVGAHLGWYTCLAATFGGFVHCFEANPLLLPLIRENLAANDLQGKVALHNAAVSDLNGTVAFPGDSMRPGLTVGHGSTRVRSITLDEYFQDREDVPGVFKIDVEGAETRVLRGMSGLLERHRPALLLEVHPGKLQELGSSHHEVEDILRRAGYGFIEVGTSGRNSVVWSTCSAA